MFKDLLKEIKTEVDSFSGKEEIANKAVDRKLNRSLDNFEKNIELNVKYILSRNNYKVLKALDRAAKKKEKKGKEED